MNEDQNHRPPAPIAYSPEQAAVAVGRSRSRIFKAIKDEELTARKDGKATLLEADELRRWVRSLPTIGRQPTDSCGMADWELAQNKTMEA